MKFKNLSRLSRYVGTLNIAVLSFSGRELKVSHLEGPACVVTRRAREGKLERHLCPAGLNMSQRHRFTKHPDNILKEVLQLVCTLNAVYFGSNILITPQWATFPEILSLK